MVKIAYVYTLKQDPDRVNLMAYDHASYWGSRRLADLQGGLFEDRTGGIITLSVGSMGQARALVQSDPFMRAGLVDTYHLKVWEPVAASA